MADTITSQNTGRFIILSVNINIYNKKTKGPTLMELFTATGKLIFFLELEMFDVCITGDTAHIDTICWRVCDKNLNIVTMCAVSPVVHTSKIFSCQKNFFNFPVAVNNSIKVGPLVFLLQMFVITENIMKRPVLTSPESHCICIN